MEAQGATIRRTCSDFSLNQMAYRYRSKKVSEDAVIPDWLIRPTFTQKNYGFGLCLLHLCSMKGFGCNHKRVYRPSQELELNLRIKPKKRLICERPYHSAVPAIVNQRWSMGFVHGQLADGRSFRLFNMLDDYKNKKVYSQPNKPQQNAYVERYNRTVHYD